MRRANQEIRDYAAKNKVYLWEIALAMGISEPTMTRKLRMELPEHERGEIMRIIQHIAELHTMSD